ncbi:SRPBCC family protein [Paenibacillus sp. Y412MC10]|uniref:SRPBCC family protein n=1 Tax=Geobacillus sp. (strain Y412MC10) TaxID=481743 RepID=UPI0011A3176D|nr:SRPBCC family protein [Paenibacillus sp. Y412MC10]
MSTIREELMIYAPIEVCFDVSRNVDDHSRTVWPHTNERVVAGRMSGLLEAGDTVVFEARHFGIRQRLTSKVAEMDKPYSFTDEMQKGAFRHLTHRHEFEEIAGGTLVRDILDFSAPFGWVGRVFDALVLEKYMRSFIRYRQRTLKALIENENSPKSST